jgi:integrase
MRLTEQYSCTWSQVDGSRRAIDLTVTKNGTARTIHLNPDALAAIESVRLPAQKPKGRVFTRQGTNDRFDTRSWFVPCLAECVFRSMWAGDSIRCGHLFLFDVGTDSGVMWAAFVVLP